MSVDEALKAALDPLEIPYAPNLYTGDETEYITTNGQIIPEVVKQAVLLYIKATYEDIPGSEWQPQAERMLYPYKELRV